MVKQLVGITLITLTSLVVVVISAPAFAQSTTSPSVTAGYTKGNNKFTIVVRATAGTKLDMYVNDKHPTQAIVNKQGWATFVSVQLNGTGKLSFTEVLNSKHGSHQQPVAYTERFTITDGKVTFSNYVTESTAIIMKTLPYITTTVQDSLLAKGKSQVKTKGVNGTEKLTYQITWTNAQQTAKTLASTVIVTPAVNEVVEDGTYVAPTTPAPTQTSATVSTPSTSCYPLSDEGTCYEPGEYCRDADEGTSGIAGDGEAITCEDNDGLRWEPN